MQSILEIREHWYQAYKRGDTETLKKYESPDLEVTFNGVKDYAERYLEIEKKVTDNTWFQPELSREETIEESSGLCSITGRAEITEGKAKGKVLSYSETWKYINSAWSLESLQIHA